MASEKTTNPALDAGKRPPHAAAPNPDPPLP